MDLQANLNVRPRCAYARPFQNFSPNFFRLRLNALRGGVASRIAGTYISQLVGTLEFVRIDFHH